MLLPRDLESHLHDLLAHFPVVALIGARQVGKTTLGRQVMADAPIFTFDPTQDLGGARSDPDLFLQNHATPCFLDEVQYVPELLSALKRDVDRNPKKGRFLLSGSHNLALLRQVSESMAGRVALMHLSPMSVRELWNRTSAPSFVAHWLKHRTIPGQHPLPPVDSLPHCVWRGGFPGLIGLPNRLVPTFFDSYLGTYLERDVRLLGNVHSLPTFRRFLRLLAALTAQELNALQLGRELEVDRKTALSWKATLEATWLWGELPAWTRNSIKRIAGKAKGHLCDTGLGCHLLQITSPDALFDHPAWGALYETFVHNELKKALGCLEQTPNASHFRTRGGAEVDLVLEQNGWLYPFEFKAKSNPSAHDARGILAFREAAGSERIADGLVVSAVPEPRRLNATTWAIPWWWIG
jgi:uncharacterized protein